MLNYEFIDPEEQINSEDFQFVESFLKSTGRTQLGWHYITDISWIYSKVKQWPKGFKILDAGGGLGPIQFLLAEMGFDVTNIDLSLSAPPNVYRHRYQTQLKTLPSFVPTSYREFLSSSHLKSKVASQVKKWVKSSPVYQFWISQKYITRHERWRSAMGLSDNPLGQIQWYIANLCDMPEIPSCYFDAVVSLSSLEHIPDNLLDQALAEIRRVLKPDAYWAITTSGTEEASTWFHEPSQGYCFSVSDLQSRFRANALKGQNPEIILSRYRECSYLKNNLADFYKKTGKFGMPWGIWDPKYIPVGITQ